MRVHVPFIHQNPTEVTSHQSPVLRTEVGQWKRRIWSLSVPSSLRFLLEWSQGHVLTGNAEIRLSWDQVGCCLPFHPSRPWQDLPDSSHCTTLARHGSGQRERERERDQSSHWVFWRKIWLKNLALLPACVRGLKFCFWFFYIYKQVNWPWPYCYFFTFMAPICARHGKLQILRYWSKSGPLEFRDYVRGSQFVADTRTLMP